VELRVAIHLLRGAPLPDMRPADAFPTTNVASHSAEVLTMASVRHRGRAGVALIAAVVGVAALGVIAVTSAAPFDKVAVTDAAITALEHQYEVAPAAAARGGVPYFTGKASDQLTPVVEQVKANVDAGTDYPGAHTLTKPTRSPPTSRCTKSSRT
jgi:hypothetical protein